LSNVDLSGLLLPHLAGLRVDRLPVVDSMVCVEAAIKTPTASCTACGLAADRVHGRYARSLLDTAAGGRQVQLRLVVRRFLCDNSFCPKKTFAEEVHGPLKYTVVEYEPGRRLRFRFDPAIGIGGYHELIVEPRGDDKSVLRHVGSARLTRPDAARVALEHPVAARR
jgi:hypothetical protein